MADGARDEGARAARGTIPPAPNAAASSAVSAVSASAGGAGPTSRRLSVAPAAPEPIASMGAGVGVVASTSGTPPLIELLETLSAGREVAIVVTASEPELRAAAAVHVTRLLRQRANAVLAGSGEETEPLVRQVSAR